MSTDAHKIEPIEPIEGGDPSHLNATPAPDTEPPVVEEIVSVNRKGSSDNKVAKAIFFLLIGAMLVGVMAWFSQNWLNHRKAQMRANNGPKAATDTSQVFNPEKTGTTLPKPKLGADSGLPPPSLSAAASSPVAPGAVREDGIRPMRGADGKVMPPVTNKSTPVAQEVSAMADWLFSNVQWAKQGADEVQPLEEASARTHQELEITQ